MDDWKFDEIHAMIDTKFDIYLHANNFVIKYLVQYATINTSKHAHSHFALWFLELIWISYSFTKWRFSSSLSGHIKGISSPTR